ncbi:hypothetical protein ACWX0P_27260 [Vibrio mediterranei]
MDKIKITKEQSRRLTKLLAQTAALSAASVLSKTSPVEEIQGWNEHLLNRALGEFRDMFEVQDHSGVNDEK